jgi:hypothetical protein
MEMLFIGIENRGVIVGEIRALGTDSVYAHVLDASVGTDPLVWLDGLGVLDDIDGPGRVVLRCGEPVRANLSANDDDRLLASWSQSGWARFDEELNAAVELAAQRDIELMVRPGALGMLSDAICTCSWARRSESLGCSLLLDPIGWLVPSMLADAGDHLRRIADLCSSCPKVGGVMVRSVRLDGDGGLVETAIHEGVIDPELIVSTLGDLVRDAPAVIGLDEADLDRF